MARLKSNELNYINPARHLVLHVIALILSILTFILVIIAWISSAAPSPKTPSGQLSNIPWLLHINQTTESNLDGEGVGRNAGDKTLRRWGIGAFGWCEWNYNKVDMMEPGDCVKKMGWSLPDGGRRGSDIRVVDMPVAIGKVLPVVSHFLLVPMLLMLALSILLIMAFRKTPSVTGGVQSDARWKLKSENFRSVQQGHLSFYMRLRTTWVLALTTVSALVILIVVIVCGVGIAQVNGGDQKLKATLGVGLGMLIAALILSLIVNGFVYFGGLRVHKPQPGQYSKEG